MEHKQRIETYFRAHPPATIKQAMATIEKLTGLKRSETQVEKFLKSIGLKCRKVGMLPAKADPEKQAEFKQEKLEPVLEEAKAGQRKELRLFGSEADPKSHLERIRGLSGRVRLEFKGTYLWGKEGSLAKEMREESKSQGVLELLSWSNQRV